MEHSIQNIEDVSDKSIFIEVEKDTDYEIKTEYHQVNVETHNPQNGSLRSEAEIVSAIADKMAIIAHETSLLHQLWEELAALKNNINKM